MSTCASTAKLATQPHAATTDRREAELARKQTTRAKPAPSREVPAERCFVISPIGAEGSEIREHADAVFDYVIKKAMDTLGISAERSDHMTEPGLISEQMLRAILNYDFCVAVLTFHNPNVFYELAIAQAANRPLIILVDKDTELPFDIKDMRCVYYDLKPRSLFEGIYADQIMSHVKALRSGSGRTGGPFEGLLSSSDECCTVLPSASEFGGPPDWLELLEQTEREFAIAGINLNDWRKTPGFMDSIRRKLEEECRVRVLVMHPENPAFPGLINDLTIAGSANEVRAGLAETTSFFEKLATTDGNLELRQISTGCPHFNLTLTDGVAVAIPYLYSARTALSPVLRCPSDSPLYETFRQEFNSLWDVNQRA